MTTASPEYAQTADNVTCSNNKKQFLNHIGYSVFLFISDIITAAIPFTLQ
jgi:hypothetical protein